MEEKNETFGREKLISDTYLRLNVKKHGQSRKFGSYGHRYRDCIVKLCRQIVTRDVLDYGAGKGTLADSMPFPIRQYDPAVEKISALPGIADLVVCTDTLEHVEPGRLGAVLRHIWALTRHAAFLAIGIGPSKKFLADGRNAHLIQMTPTEWRVAVIRHCPARRVEIHDVGLVRENAMEMTLWKTRSESS